MDPQSDHKKEAWIVGLCVIAGLLACLAILWLFVFKTASYKRGAGESAAERMREFRESAQSEEEATLTQRFGKIRQEWLRTAAGLQGNERKVAESIAAEFEALSPKIAAYDRAYVSLAEAGYAAPPFANIEEIAARASLIEEFKTANEGLKIGFEEIGARLKRRLNEAKVPDILAEREIRSFLDGLNIGEIRKLRELDAVLAALMLRQLEFYRKEWGRWAVGEDGEVEFGNPDVQKAFDESQAEFQTAGAEQQRLLQPNP